MLTIGNNETCPYCDKEMKDFKIEGKSTVEHLMKEHKEQFMTNIESDRK